MVVTRRDGLLVDTRFSELPRFLDPGDLLVLNVSATVPASLPARRRDGTELRLHLSTPTQDGRWLVELRRKGAPFRAGDPDERLELPDGGSATLLARFARGHRLWAAELSLPLPLERYLAEHAEPIRYSYVPERRPLDDYLNVYALEPGSVEPPSAGRPFTPELVTELVAHGVLLAPVVLHAGVSSLEDGEDPYPERFRIPEQTARLVNATRAWGGRVVAVGTTTLRALETVADGSGSVSAGEGWTSLVITPERGIRAVDGLLTGWHEPESSHLELLRTVAGDDLLDRSYEAARERGYLWHEFGDSQLIL